MSPKFLSNVYITKESPQLRSNGSREFKGDTISNLESGFMHLYMAEIIDYQDEITGKKKRYWFDVKLTFTNGQKISR